MSLSPEASSHISLPIMPQTSNIKTPYINSPNPFPNHSQTPKPPSYRSLSISISIPNLIVFKPRSAIISTINVPPPESSTVAQFPNQSQRASMCDYITKFYDCQHQITKYAQCSCGPSSGHIVGEKAKRERSLCPDCKCQGDRGKRQARMTER